MFKVTSLNQVMDSRGNVQDEQIHVFGKYNYLQPQDSRQYLFCLTPRNDLKANYKQLKGATNIGKKHALKKYDQFALNTSCFRGSTGSNITPSCAISPNFCYKNNE